MVVPTPTASPCTAATIGLVACDSAEEAHRRQVGARGRAVQEVTQVVAGGEGVAAPMDQHHADGRVLLGGADRSRQIVVHREGYRVRFVRSVELDELDRARPLRDDGVRSSRALELRPICICR